MAVGAGEQFEMDDPNGGVGLMGWFAAGITGFISMLTAGVGYGRLQSKVSEHDRRLDGHSELQQKIFDKLDEIQRDISDIRANNNHNGS